MEMTKRDTLNFFTDENSSLLKEINDKAIDYFRDKLDELAIEGLAKKGFTFKTKDELIDFIKSNCVCECFGFIRRYFVNNIPFLEYDQTPNFSDLMQSELKMKVTFGKYRFL